MLLPAELIKIIKLKIVLLCQIYDFCLIYFFSFFVYKCMQERLTLAQKIAEEHQQYQSCIDKFQTWLMSKTEEVSRFSDMEDTTQNRLKALQVQWPTYLGEGRSEWSTGKIIPVLEVQLWRSHSSLAEYLLICVLVFPLGYCIIWYDIIWKIWLLWLVLCEIQYIM